MKIVGSAASLSNACGRFGARTAKGWKVVTAPSNVVKTMLGGLDTETPVRISYLHEIQMSDKPIRARIVELAIVPEGEPLYSERNITLRIEDEGGGEFLTISQCNDSGDTAVRIDPSEWPAVQTNANFMLRQIEAWEAEAEKPDKPYPKWVCETCGARYGTGRRCMISTWHYDTCGICGERKSVTEPRDFGHMKDDSWKHHGKGTCGG